MIAHIKRQKNGARCTIFADRVEKQIVSNERFCFYMKIIKLKKETKTTIQPSRQRFFFDYSDAKFAPLKSLLIVYSSAKYARHVMRFGNSLNELFMALGNGEKPNRLRHDHLEKRFVIGT